MTKATTRKEACEAYEHRWQRQHVSADQWPLVLDLLYEGKGATQIIRELLLDPECKSSLTTHARKHRGYIAFMRGVRLKDKRLQLAGTLSGRWEALIEKIFTIAMDESTRPGVRVKAATVAQKEMTELQKLAAMAVEEFQREDLDGDRKMGDVAAMVQRIAADVFGIRRDDHDGK